MHAVHTQQLPFWLAVQSPHVGVAHRAGHVRPVRVSARKLVENFTRKKAERGTDVEAEIVILAINLAGHLHEAGFGIHQDLAAHAPKMNCAPLSDRELAVGKAHQHVVVTKHDGRNFNLGGHARCHHGRGGHGLQRNFRLFHSGERDLHSANGDLMRRRRGAGLVVAGDVEPHQRGGTPRHFKIGIAVVDPSTDASGRAVR